MKMLIGGKKVDASDKKTIDVINPANMQVIDTVPAATKEDIDLAIRNAEEGFKEWSAVPLGERIVILRRFLDLYKQHSEELAQLVSHEEGKPIDQARACIGWSTDLIDTYIERARFMGGETMAEQNRAGQAKEIVMTIREPLGIVVAVVPFNYPVDQLCHKAIPALVMGNSLIVKPATETPMADIRYVELLHEAGVPGNAAQIVTGRGSVIGDLLTGDPRIAKVALTGSTSVGIQIGTNCMKNMHHCSLELGGNDPMVVLADADIDVVVEEIMGGRLHNAGQTCCSPKRYIVHNSVKAEFTEKLIATLASKKQGDPMEPGTDVGPMVSLEQAKEIEEQINLSVNQGGKVLLGGKRFNQTFIQPTVMEANRDMDIMKDMEVFGPVFPIIGFDTLDEAIELCNMTMYGLCSSVFGKNVFDVMKIAKGIQAGACVINGHGNYRTADEPFGGYKMSGIGREGGAYTLDAMSQLKTLIMRL